MACSVFAGGKEGSGRGLIMLADIQAVTDLRNIPINQVGIKEIRHPIRLKERRGGEQHTVANFNMYVSLPHHFKGTHMSRFVEILNEHEREITVDTFKEILVKMTKRLEAEEGHIEMTFPYFVQKKAPISGVESLMDYQVKMIGKVINNKVSLRIKAAVPVTTLCPCSKEISKYGAHNQRAQVTVEVEAEGFIWIEEVIDIVERQASCELYGLLKRPDEKYVTERAYENPKFVEDLVRDIALQFNKHDKIVAYKIESENFESIHNHSAYAMIEKEKR